MPQTFAQYLISRILPPDIKVEQQIDKSYLNKILTAVATKHPEQYDRVISDLKRLADHFSTMEVATIGLDEIDVPNREKRDAIIKKYQNILVRDKASGDTDTMLTHLGDLQKELAANDLDNTHDDATLMVKSSLTGKKTQLMKMRSGPGVVSDTAGNIIPEIFPKSYAQGLDPLHFWLGATESRKNIAEGQVTTASPGELNKVLSNILATAVVSENDCGTPQGIFLATRDDTIIDRYLAKDTGGYPRNTLITPDIQQALLKKGIVNVFVRSPQTCHGKDGSVCQLCMGLRPGTGKLYEIGDNAGLITAGNIGEPLTQMVLSSKHSTSFAEVNHDLKGEKGLRQFIEVPKNYPNRKVLCEVIGIVYKIHKAPQGGTIVTVRQTKPVPERYIEIGIKNKSLKGFWDYYIPPQLNVVDNISEGTEVWPGMELSDGVDNMKDVSRLRNLGYARSAASQNMYQIYKNTDVKMDRRHFELLSRAANSYVRVVKAPRGYDLLPGETIKYQELVEKVQKLPHTTVDTKMAMGKVLGEGVLNITVGTEIDSQTMKYLLDNDINKVVVCPDLEVEAVSVPITRVVNKSNDWIAALNHRYIKDAIKDAAALGKGSNIHSFNPVTAYAYGAELEHGVNGKY